MPTKLFLDTNIIFDVIDVSRPNTANVRKLLLACEEKDLTFFISAVTVNTIVYLMQEKFKLSSATLKEKLLLLFNVTEVVAFDHNIIATGLGLGIDDLEDAFQYASALECGADYLVTEDKKFMSTAPKGSNLKVISTLETISMW